MSSAVDPNLAPVIVAGGGGGGASLPDDPAAVLLDVASPSTFVVLDPAGVGAAITPADARAALADTTTYDFASATGVTLVNGTVGGSAAVTGGVLRLTCPDTPSAGYFGGTLEAPYGQIAVPLDSTGRQPIRWRARARVVAISATGVGYLLAVSSGGSQRAGLFIGADGSGGAEDNSGPSTYATWAAGVLPIDGTGYVEIEVCGPLATYRYGTGTTSVPPTTWTTVATAALPSAALYNVVRLVGATYSTAASPRVVDFDDLVFEVIP